MVRLAAALAAASFLVAGCAGEDSRAGFGVARQQEAGEVPGDREALGGTVVIAYNGCLHLRLEDGSEPWIVWPPDAEMSDAGGVEWGGAAFADGTRVKGTGARVTLEDLPDGGNPDSYFASFGGFCGADDAGVVAFDSVDPAEG